MVAVEVPLLDREAGWTLDKRAQAKARFDDNGGDGNGGSSCVGWNVNAFKNEYAVFHIQHGHVTRGFRKSDAYQNCRGWLHLRRKKIIESKVEPVAKALDWSMDVDFELPPNTVKKDIAVETFDGRRFTIRSQDEVPYSWFDLMISNRVVKFRPRPQREF